jgi:hypothetical protein
MGKRTSFCQDRHASFQNLLARFGEPKFCDIKRRVYEGVSAAQTAFALSPLDDRFKLAPSHTLAPFADTRRRAHRAIVLPLAAHGCLRPG